jgi:hypothetical protein
MLNTTAYIRRETLVSMVINTVLSFAFFLGVFGRSGDVPVWGMGAYVFDFVPQSFMIGLMAILVPGALAGKARRAGKVAPWAGASRLPKALVPRAVLVALGSVALGVGGSALVLTLLGAQSLPYTTALTVKLVFGAALALLVTPPGLKAALA